MASVRDDRIPTAQATEVVASQTALSPSQILHFRRLLATADGITDAYFKQKRHNKRRRIECAFGLPPTVDFSKMEEDEHVEEADDSVTIDARIASAMVKTISVLTSSEEPGRLESEADAIKWTRDCIMNFRNSTVDKTRREEQPYVFDEKQTMQAMHLMTGLNDLLSQARTKPH